MYIPTLQAVLTFTCQDNMLWMQDSDVARIVSSYLAFLNPCKQVSAYTWADPKLPLTQCQERTEQRAFKFIETISF